jgi:lipopolysaccharide export system protein LptA
VRWQKAARLLIAGFVIVFAGVVFYFMRQRALVSSPVGGAVAVTDPKALSETGPGVAKSFKDNKVVSSVQFEKQMTYADGKTKAFGVKLLLTDKDGKPVTVTGDEAEILSPQGQSQTVNVGKIVGHFRLETASGVVVTAAEATYDKAEAIFRIPGPVEFTKGRMKGTSVGATYNEANNVFWLLQQARVVVTPDAAGAGAMEGTAESASFARSDNYFKLERNAKIVAEGRTAEAVVITALLDESGEKIQQLQLRDQSRIIGTGASAQRMIAKHIDMMYAPDGRTLQSSKLMENGVVELPGAAGGPGSRISASTIDIGMSPDGATVTSLQAVDKVQVDLPADATTPGRQIRSSTLRGAGAPGQGLQNLVFEGGVDYLESRPASGKTPASERKARSQRLIVDTKPGLGPVDRADFRGNASFQADKITAEAPRALYNAEKDQLDLSPSPGDPGTGPILNNAQLRVEARNIQVSPSTQKLAADTDVRSIIKPQKKGEANSTRMPVMLKQDQPGKVTANRLAYDGVAEATYTGNALLWQENGSRIAGDTVVLNDSTGNLTARGNVRTTMMLTDEDPKTKLRKPTETRASAETLVYDDAKRLATYTSAAPATARLTNSQGDMSGHRIDLFLKEGGGELDRIEADSAVRVALDTLFAVGRHLVYTAADDIYVLTGEPVVAIQRDAQGACKQTDGVTMTYRRINERLARKDESLLVEGMSGLANFRQKPLDACPAELRR